MRAHQIMTRPVITVTPETTVSDLKAMYEECGRHQIDFIRRDNDRLFKHGERMIETTTKLFSKSPQN